MTIPCQSTLTLTPSPLIDVFCQVIDNYGDIGVCWRLSKDLSNTLKQYQCNTINFDSNSIIARITQSIATNTHQNEDRNPYTIRLWVDDLKSFAKIEPLIDPHLEQQYLEDIHVWLWNEVNIEQCIPAPLVIEAFATELDTIYQAKMATHTQYWLNLEYLSAEPWVESFHGKPSPQKNGVPKYFFFPGFNPNTGGLICENDLISRLTQFDDKAKQAWLADYIHPDAARDFAQHHHFINVFCYPSAPFEALVYLAQSLSKTDKQAVTLLIPEGVMPQAETQLAQFTSVSTTESSPIRIQRFAFCPQTQFDYLLAVADINIIRGEDSFVRAIWSGKPFIWHIYEQHEGVHLDKLKAWLDSCPFPNPFATLNTAWNYYAYWNNAAIHSNDENKKTVSNSSFENEAQAQRQHYLNALTTQIDTLSHTVPEHYSDFFIHYRDYLLKNPTLSFSILNFQAKQS